MSRNGSEFENAVYESLKQTYQEPEYKVTRINEHIWKRGWAPDFVLEKGKSVVCWVEVKDTNATSETLTNQIQRAFSCLALSYLRSQSHDSSFVVLPYEMISEAQRRYGDFFAEIGCTIISKDDFPAMREEGFG